MEDGGQQEVGVGLEAVGGVVKEGVAHRLVAPVVPEGGQVDLWDGESQQELVEEGVAGGELEGDHATEVVHVDLVALEDHHLDLDIRDDDRGEALLVVGRGGEHPLGLQEGVEGGGFAVGGEGRQATREAGEDEVSCLAT